MSRMIKVLPEPSFKICETTVKRKEQISSLMARYGIYTIGGTRNGDYCGWVNKGEITLYHAQKLRRKVKHTKIPRSKKNTHVEPRYAPTLVREGHWKVTIFRFPIARVVSAKQEARTFRAVIH